MQARSFLTVFWGAFAIGCGGSQAATGAAASSSTAASSVTSTGAGGHGGSGAGGSGGAAPMFPAPHPPLPEVVTRKGPVLTTPKLVAITFDADPLQASIDGFMTQLGAATAYWSGATNEYGVGPLTILAPQHLSEMPPSMPISDGDVQSWLQAKIQGGNGFPQADANTVFAVYYPANTTVTLGGETICQGFQGYHNDFQLGNNAYVSYAVIGRCPPPAPNVTQLDNLTAEASHEFIEAATDPLPQDKPAYLDIDPAHRSWLLIEGGGETGDLCAPFPDTYYKPKGIDSLVTRAWSNAAAAASHDPCEPDGSEPYFNSAPDEPDTIIAQSPTLGQLNTKGNRIPVGQSKTIALHLFSDAPTAGPWKVKVLDAAAFFGGTPTLSFKLDKNEGQNGDIIMLTVTALGKSALGASPFWIENDLGQVSTVWLGAVGN